MNSDRVILSRLAITGLVATSTPSVVLKEIAEAHNIDYDDNKFFESRYITKFVHEINTTNVKYINQPYGLEEYRSMARFVNKNFEWKKVSLKQAFNLLIEYTDINKISSFHKNFKYGPQTPDHPDSLNACILYAICKINKLDTHFSTTIDEMASNIRLLFRLKESDIYHSVRLAIQNAMMYGGCEGYQLINILSQIDPERSIRMIKPTQHDVSKAMELEIEEDYEIVIDYDSLERIGTEISNRTIRRNPNNHMEAVAMAAIYYKMDISRVKSPLAEYQELTRTPFFPIDKELMKRLELSDLHPDSLKNPRLDKIFNPYLPPALYDDGDLHKMCQEEGCTREDIIMDGVYSRLQGCYLMKTFIHGKQGNIINNITTFDDVWEINYDNVIIYGIRGGSMRAYTYGELSDTFKHLKRFQKPDRKEQDESSLFPTHAINKLYKLCDKDQRITESDDIFRERIELAEQIERTRLYIETNQEQVRQFINIYETTYDKSKIDLFFMLLLKSAMYMRGWIGEGPYPLNSADTVVADEERPSVDVRVTQSIQDIEASLLELQEVGDLIKQLPLMFYENGELLPSTSDDEGKTLLERINIVKGGENGTGNVNSCIRMTSNRFAASAYFYMSLMNLPIPFDISQLSKIQ